MTIAELVEKKQNKQNLAEEEIKFFVDEFNSGKFSKEEANEFIKLFAKRNIDFDEAYFFAKAISETGRKINLKTQKICVDKISIGGFGDVVALIISPILASLGFAVPKMCFEENDEEIGSMDRLKLLNGFYFDISEKQASKLIDNTGMCFFKKPDDVLTVDSKFYDLLRENKMEKELPFMAIMGLCKKLVLPIRYVLLDIRCGEASSVKNMVDAEILAEYMTNILFKAGIKSSGTITYATEPISKSLGIRHELLSAIQILSGRKTYKQSALFKVCRDIVVGILELAEITSSKQEAKNMITNAIDSGFALEKFYQTAFAQKADMRAFDEPDILIPDTTCTNIVAEKNGYLQDINMNVIKKAITIMGGIKDENGQIVDDNVAIELFVGEGIKVKKGKILASVYYSINNPKFASGIRAIRECFVIDKKKPSQTGIVKKEIVNVSD